MSESSAITSFPAWPQFGDDEIAAATAVLRSGKVNYWSGNEGRQFEREFADFVGCRHAIAVANGTVALELTLRAFGVGPGDEVITSARTFIASASCAVAVGSRPVIADVDRDSQNLTAETIRAVLTPRTKAIIAVHLAGRPCEMDSIMELAREHGLKVIEDCAQAHGATYKGRHVGSIGDAGAFSFCQDKTMTTAGEGGMVTTNSDDLWERAWAYKDHGKSYDAVYRKEHSRGYRWLHESFGTNWRMTEVQSAVGRIALRKLPAWLETRRRYAQMLMDAFSLMPGLRVTPPPAYIDHAFYKYYVFVVPEALRAGWSRDRIIEATNAEGIPCFSGTCSEIYLEKAFPPEWRPRTRLPVARALGETSLMFLVHPTLTEENIRATAATVAKVMEVAAQPRAFAAVAAQRTSPNSICPNTEISPASIPYAGAPIGDELNMENLLGREPAQFDPESLHRCIAGRVVMVTGAAGSIGAELCRQIADGAPRRIVCIDRAETPLFFLQRELSDSAERVTCRVADITDASRMRSIMLEHRIEAIFHAAAYKHVPMMEDNVIDALKNNVFGLVSLLKCAEEYGCEDFLLISSDKAVNPTSFMGCTKRLGELVLAARPKSAMRCISVRFGNVLGSQGSVVPLFREQIRTRRQITVTHPEMTRYFMTAAEAVSLVLQSFRVGVHGDILVLDMGSPVRIVDLARALIHLSGMSESEVEIVYTRLRPGEKLREELFYAGEQPSPTAVAKVRRTRTSSIAWPTLMAHLQQLRNLALVGDDALIRAKVREIIPQYARSPYVAVPARKPPEAIRPPAFDLEQVLASAND